MDLEKDMEWTKKNQMGDCKFYQILAVILAVKSNDTYLFPFKVFKFNKYSMLKKYEVIV